MNIKDFFPNCKSILILLLLVLILPINNIYSQEYLDLARVSFILSPQSDFINGQSGNSLNEWTIQLDLPMVLDDDNAFITSFAGSGLSLSLSPNQEQNSQIYSFNFRFGLNTQYNDTWSGTYLAIPKLTTDFSNGLRRGYQIGFVALVNQKKSERLKYTYGIFTNTEEFGQLIVPLIGGYYVTENLKWEITALMPALMDINYSLKPSSSIGLKYEGLGTTYSIDNEYFNDAYMTRGSTQLYAYYQNRLTTSLFLRLKAGYELRNYRVFNQNDKVSLSLASIYVNDNRTLLNSEIEDNFLFSLEFFYRFNFPKEKTPTLNDKI